MEWLVSKPAVSVRQQYKMAAISGILASKIFWPSERERVIRLASEIADLALEEDLKFTETEDKPD